jgi:glycerol-3-phosphate acyltransferase PlsY
MISYVIGSFPTAYLIGRLKGINIFEIGSGNMGATNVTRSLGFRWGALVFLIDAGKGVLAVLVARLMPGDPTNASVIAAIAVVIGHNWSLLVKLITGKVRGGKGAATASGTWLVMFAAWWYLIAIPLSVCFAVIYATRYVSLAVLVTISVGTLTALILIGQGVSGIPQVYVIYLVLLTALIYFRHRENIQRLIEGRERRLGDPARENQALQ